METLTKDTLQLIQETAVKASNANGKVQFVPIPGEPPHIYASIKADGEWDRHEAIAPPRMHNLAGVFEAISYANTKGSPEHSVVWFDENGITIILDDSTRRDIAVVQFKLSPQFARLKQVADDEERFGQAAFRRLLRVDFHGCTPNDLLLDWVSDCEFGSRGNTVGTITKDKSSFGKDIEEQVKSKDRGACPDELILSMPVFDDPGLREERRVVCDVEIHMAEQQFELTPFPGQIQRAIDAELANIESLMSGENGIKCPVFKGRP